VHISQLSDRFIKDPREAVSPGDQVKVRVLDVNFEKKQISLSIRAASESPRAERRPERRPEQPNEQRHERGERRGPRANGDRKEGRPGPLPQAQRGSHGVGQPHKPKGPPKPAFTNNPFAGLASLKKELKSR